MRQGSTRQRGKIKVHFFVRIRKRAGFGRGSCIRLFDQTTRLVGMSRHLTLANDTIERKSPGMPKGEEKEDAEVDDEKGRFGGRWNLGAVE
jgi:hypothetical protein